MGCDICGKNEILRKALVEGALLNVCAKCASFGVLLEDKKGEIRETIYNEPEIIEILIPDFDYQVKTKREILGLSQKQLAFEINEKESVIHLIEVGKLKPSIDTARKLEKFLKIVLLAREQENYDPKIDFKNKSLTIGDLIKLKDEEEV